MNKLEKSLKDIFRDERLVFWYDDNATMREEYDAISLDGVTNIEVQNDEFSVKYRVMRQEPKQKFLLYFAYAKPIDTENWLLDLNLANRLFYTDRAALVLQDMDWGHDHDYDIDKEFVETHYAFFTNKKRVDRLKKKLSGNETQTGKAYKILSVLCSCEPDLESILLALFGDMATDSTRKLDEVSKYNFDDFLWTQVSQRFGYVSDTPTLKDFLINLFKRNFLQPEETTMNNESVVFLNRWMDSARNKDNFETLSERVEQELRITDTLEAVDAADLVELDVFKTIDLKVLHDLRVGIIKETMTTDQVLRVIGGREHKYWHALFEHEYKTIRYGVEFIHALNRYDLTINSLVDGIEKYTDTLYKLDLLYRKFGYHYEEAQQHGLLKDLSDKVNKLYSNSYLLKLNDNWQCHVNETSSWEVKDILNQRTFFEKQVKPYLEKGQRIFVVISDALRYECGVELTELINREKRYTAKLSPMLSTLPSYTQLGMAALLPNKTLSYQKKSDVVAVDGKSSVGTEARTKILQATVPKSVAITAKDFMAMKATSEGREFAKQHDVIYIYHNGIDATGDDSKSESKVFGAVEDEFVTLRNILNNIANMNGANAIVTSDHGFIYQGMSLEDSDFVDPEQKGTDDKSEKFKYNRRFIIGKNLAESSSLKKFTGNQVGIDDETEFLIPKSINRLRVKGAGSQFVHGGAALQEVVIPVIYFNNKKVNTIELVDVDKMGGGSLITSGLLKVSFYQEEAVADKRLPRVLRVGFYASDNTLISNQHTMTFDSDESEGGNRVQKVTFTFSHQADSYNNKEVELRLEEQIGGTNEFVAYRDYKYTIKKSFTSDFGDF